jgi:hypothetical protein
VAVFSVPGLRRQWAHRQASSSPLASDWSPTRPAVLAYRNGSRIGIQRFESGRRPRDRTDVEDANQ